MADKKKNKKKNDNWLLKGARRLLGSKKNVAPAAQFYQSQKRKQLMIQQLLDE